MPPSTPPLEKPAQEEEDDWDLLGLPCDCPCDSCTVTAVAPSYAEYQALQRAHAARDDDDGDDEDEDDAACEPRPCECVQFDPPHSSHELILHVLEDFFRYRVHLHRITFATSLANAEKRMQRQGQQPRQQQPRSLQTDADATDRLDSPHRRRHYDRALSLLRARARRDLKHLELLEACANQLGWNHPAAPPYHPLVSFVETAQPAVLAWIVVEFLEYFLVQKTATSNFDKASVAVLADNLVQFAIHTGDLESGENNGGTAQTQPD